MTHRLSHRLSLLTTLFCLLFQAAAAQAERNEAKITLVQLTTRDQPPDAIIERMAPYFAEASAYGSDLIVFPEYVLGGRITIEHPRVKAFFDLARQHRMYAIVCGSTVGTA